MVTKLIITIHGLNHALNFLAKAPQQVKTEMRSELGKVADNAATSFQKRAHVVTGYMKRNIKKTRVTETMAEVQAQAGYSGHENARGGSHAFWDQSLQEIEKQAADSVYAAIQRVVNRRGF